MHALRLATLLGGVLLGLGSAHAQRPAFLDNALAVEIEADSAELSEERGVSIYRGNVVLRRGPLEMRGDRLRILRDDQTGKIEARLSGAPASARHQTRISDEPVMATAREIVYTTIVEVLELVGNAVIRRGDDELTGDQVRYDVASARIQAEGGSERVHIVITPPEGATNKPKTP